MEHLRLLFIRHSEGGQICIVKGEQQASSDRQNCEIVQNFAKVLLPPSRHNFDARIEHQRLVYAPFRWSGQIAEFLEGGTQAGRLASQAEGGGP